jgi:hypothetical protein
LVLRLTLCGFLLNSLYSRASFDAETVLAAIAAVLTFIGLWTPVAGLLATVALVWSGPSGGGVWCVLAAPTGIALSLIGPGAVSVDAYLFGRKRVIFDDRA